MTVAGSGERNGGLTLLAEMHTPLIYCQHKNGLFILVSLAIFQKLHVSSYYVNIENKYIFANMKHQRR